MTGDPSVVLESRSRRRSIFTKSIQDHRRGIFGWGASLSVIVALMCALWPSVRDLGDLDALLEAYPEALREVFAIEDLSTPTGFLNSELFSFMVPTMFLVFAIGRGARTLAGEEEQLLLEPLLSTSLSRTRLLLGKAAGLGVAIVSLAGVLFAASVVSTSVASMDIAIRAHAMAAWRMMALGMTFGAVSLAVGAATGRRARATGAGAIAAGSTYLLFVLGQLVDVVEPLRWLSPFTHLLADGVIDSDFDAAPIGVVAVGACIVAVAIPFYERRDSTAS